MAEKNALNYAIYLLEKRDYSENELYKKICTKYEEKESAEAVAKVSELGYVNDEKYAFRLAEKYLSAYGKKRVSDEMYKRGLDRDLIKMTLEETSDPEKETEKIIKAINAKTKGHFPCDRKERDKLFAFLCRKGFSPDEIGRALRQMKDGQNGESEDFYEN